MCEERTCEVKPVCEVCRTINIAEQIAQPKTCMEIYEKSAVEKPCPKYPELALHPGCIKVCTKEEYKIHKSGIKPLVLKPPHYGHGKLMYAVKAGILFGAAYFTYHQGIWGEQKDVTECIRRWRAYMVNLNSRRPPTFDSCGRVVVKETVDTPGLLVPIYDLYKKIVTTCFAGVVKIPVVMKCMYFDYLKALEKQHQELVKERAIKKKTAEQAN